MGLKLVEYEGNYEEEGGAEQTDLMRDQELSWNVLSAGH